MGLEAPAVERDGTNQDDQEHELMELELDLNLPEPLTLVPEDPADPPSMAERIRAEQEYNPLAHDWVVAANVPVDFKTARRAAFRGSFRTEDGMRVDAMEVMCDCCKKPIDLVGDRERCDGKVDNTHLIGGDPGVRAKRKVSEPVGQVIQQPLPSRRGMGGYTVAQNR